MKKYICLVSLLGFIGFSGSSQAEPVTNPVLIKALETYIAKEGANPKETQYRIAEIDLNGDKKKDALVLLQDGYWCGTGGCSMLIFTNKNNDFKLVSAISLVRDPVIVSGTKTKNWRDIIVHVSGGGGDSKNVALKFNGSTYPTNPSLLKPLATNAKTQGKTVFSDPR
jgi:putative lipoprotein